jgi:hypothetical protein
MKNYALASGLAFILAGSLLSGCSSQPSGENTAAPASSSPAGQPAENTGTSAAKSPTGDNEAAGQHEESNLPKTKQGTINIEGSDQQMTFKLFEARAENSASFTTYYPEDMKAENAGSGEVRFTLNSNKDAYVSVVSLPGVKTEKEAEKAAENTNKAIQPLNEKNQAWTLKEYNIDETKNNTDYGGSVLIGKHGSGYFLVTYYFPVEAGDGMGPRIDAILKNSVWSDTGEHLVKSP